MMNLRRFRCINFLIISCFCTNSLLLCQELNITQDSLQINSVIPDVAITNVFINNRPLPQNTIKRATKKDGQESEPIQIDPSQAEIISIEFAALDCTCPEENHYKYTLEGLHENWLSAGSKRLVSFRELDYGNYTFRVKGSNNGGIWNESGESLKFIIQTPIWLKLWAIIGYFTILFALIFSLVRIIYSRIKIKDQLKFEHQELSRQMELSHLKSTFYTNVSHDLKTPLTLIVGPIEKWLHNINNEDLKNDLKMIQKNSNRMLGLINQLFDLARIDSNEMTLHTQPVNIIPILKDLVVSFSSMAEEKEINLSFTASHNSIILNIDLNKFDNIITNLLHNAFKHTATNGKIAVSVFLKHPEDDAKITNPDVNIIVRDTGEGIPADQIEKIFDRFYQGKDSEYGYLEGTGLGLALVRELTEMHNGKVRVESKINRGSIFTLSFPLADIQNADIVIDSKANSELYSSTPKDFQPVSDKSDKIEIKQKSPHDAPHLLIVEDDAETRMFLRKCLENQYNICEARNGIEGLDMAGQIDPDLVISDIMMPEMDGCELCRKIKSDELTSHIPVILLTARATLEDKIEGLEMGADDYIFKPFDSLELMTRIQNLIIQRRKLRKIFHEEIIVQPSKVTVTPVDNIFLVKLMSFVEEHIADPHLETQVLADRMGMCRMNLHRKIKAITGQTPGQFISTMRLKRAAQLIKDHAGNVTEVAYDVGFNSLSYFAHCFKTEFGILPSEFAKSQQLHV